MTTTPKVALVTGASSGFGAMTVRALADAGHTVYAGMRNVETRNRPAADEALARLVALDPSDAPRNTEAWLTTVATRL